MQIVIEIEVDKQIVRRFVRNYRVKSSTAHSHAKKWGKSKAEEEGIEQFTVHTKKLCH